MKKFTFKKQSRVVMQSKELLPAFTIIEIVVTLLLTAIVFSIAFFAYRVFHNQFQRYSNTMVKQTELFVLQKALDRDIKGSQMVDVIDRGFECHTDSASVKYFIDDQRLIRENSFAVLDTFFFKELSLVTSFENEERVVPGELIDNIRIEFTKEEKLYRFQVEKIYDAYTLILNKTN